ncbi:MAG: hypothetical protein ABIH66_07550 [bacterium]
MKPKILILAAVLGALFMLAPGRGARAQEGPTPHTLTPETLEEKISMAEFVVVGVVKDVRELPGQGTTFSRPLVVEMTAEVEVLEVLKGAIGNKTITIEFKRSERRSIPPRPDLAPGETAVLFLNRKPGGSTLLFISPFAGKEPAGRTADGGAEEEVAALVETKGQAARVEAQLTLGGEGFWPGARIVFTAVIMNTGNTPVTLYTYIVPERDIVVTRGDGARVEPARTPPSPAPVREHFTTLQPGQFIGLRGDLAAAFPLAAPGAYSATLVFECQPGKKSGAVAWSGTITSAKAAFRIAGGGE